MESSNKSCAFSWGMATVWFFNHKDLIVGVPAVMTVPLAGSRDFWKTVRMTFRFLVTFLSKALLSVFILTGQPTVGIVLVFPIFFHWRMMKPLGPSKLQRLPLHQIYPLTQSCICDLRSIPQGLCTDMHLYWQRHAFQNNPINWISQRWNLIISSMINDNRMHPS